MSDRDTFLREVDEAVRQDQYKKLWDKYGVYAIGAALLVVVGVAGYKGWNFWQEKRAEDAGSQFSAALEEGTNAAKAREILSSLAQEGPEGYRVLARFQLAAAEAKAGETDKAVADYDALAGDASVDPILQGLATLQAAALRLDKADYAEMERRLKPLIDSASPWQFSARELLGLTAYRLKDMREAERQFSALVGEQGTPPNLRERADMMLALIVGAPQALSTTSQ
ncbi:MAG TPA: tetratricopeptide repeat protein [Methyloceanibacter sp.]|jgi:hypothetical protein|nr:tetratricopeptide repeat protein [Methyloceanibacter sp.]